MKKAIVGYHRDEEQHWVAELECGHHQHVRHNPPLVSRPWVVTPDGRASMLGHPLNCKHCDEGITIDAQHMHEI
ncbi:MAG: DUF3565 domain-containing protein [Pseudomonadota bacterium]